MIPPSARKKRARHRRNRIVSGKVASAAKRRQQGSHHIVQGSALRQACGDETSQAPKALGQCDAAPEGCAAIELELEVSLKLVEQGLVVWGG